MSEEIVTVAGAGVRFGDQWALHDVDFRLLAGERVALVGPSGAGKSTFLSMLNGTVAPTVGEVRVFGRDLAALKPDQFRRTQAKLGTIHQQFDLVGPLRVIHNINAGRLADWSVGKALLSLVSPREVHRAKDALRKVGLAGKLYERTDHLSGGERQRVALARVLVQDPVAILADEPISSLDPVRGEEVMDLLRDLCVELNKTLVTSLHVFEYALSHCDRVLGLRAGRVIFDLPAASVTRELAAELYRIPQVEPAP
ncbi:MAG: ATP-binding cassette domain-containing protein [Actinobacteria bacterium]|nr:ATP-binding cassette domain-containing protein [Actinomycetota bacterium]